MGKRPVVKTSWIRTRQSVVIRCVYLNIAHLGTMMNRNSLGAVPTLRASPLRGSVARDPGTKCCRILSNGARSHGQNTKQQQSTTKHTDVGNLSELKLYKIEPFLQAHPAIKMRLYRPMLQY